MQRTILRNKKLITLISGILVAAAFASHYLLHNGPLAEGLMLAASIIGVLPIALQAYQALRVKVVSIDVLVTIAVIGALVIGNYEESAVVTFLFLFGDYLELRTLNKTRSAIRELTQMAPESALKQMEDGSYQEVLIDEVDIGDNLRVLTGAKVPVDGRVLTGEGHVNEASITGEAVPVSKHEGDSVFAPCTSWRTGWARTRPLAASSSWWRKPRTPNPKRSASSTDSPSGIHPRCWCWRLSYVS